MITIIIIIYYDFNVYTSDYKPQLSELDTKKPKTPRKTAQLGKGK